MRDPARLLGLPDRIRACLFDLDGVLTSTAELHRQAWKLTFDAVLREYADQFRPFTEQDYLEHVDGKTRADGVRHFLASRGISLPEGGPEDPPSTLSVHGVGNRKNDLLLDTIARVGVEPYAGSVRYLMAVRDAGLGIGVVTSSANAVSVLEAAGLAPFVQARVDGVVIGTERLRGKPAPDSFLACAARLGTDPDAAAVFEDALAGVRAGRAGGFAYVVGVDRAGQAAELRRAGADVVVRDLAELLEPDGVGPSSGEGIPG